MRSVEPVGGIVWIASYPKSGNTWLRALLTNYLRGGSEPADINSLVGTPGAASRRLFDEIACVKSSDLTRAEIEANRPRVYESLARRSSRRLFLKIHDARTTTSTGEPLVSRAATRGVLYIVRHPADLAVSYAHHRGCTIETAIDLLESQEHQLADGANGVEGQLPQRLLSWGAHVASWLDSGLPVHVIRYEDLHASPEGCLDDVIDFLGEARDGERARRAVAYSSFAELSRQERERGFFERPSSTRAFFRRGSVGAREGLTSSQLRRILQGHSDALLTLRYGAQ